MCRLMIVGYNKLTTLAQQLMQTRQKVPYELDYRPSQVQGQCTILAVAPVSFSLCKFILFLLLNVFAFIPFLLTHWYPYLTRYFYYNFCPLPQCTHIWILNYDQEVTIVPMHRKIMHNSQSQNSLCITFLNRYMTYVIVQDVVQVCLFNAKQRMQKVMKDSIQGLTKQQVIALRDTYGQGTMIIESPSCIVIFLRQIVRPLYLFLLYSVALWTFAQQYYYYAGVLFFISSFGLILNLYQIIKLNNEIFSLAYYQTNVNVLRNKAVQSISSLDIVPGDIVFLKQHIKMPFQGIILQGSALINQCSLTGESVPVVKKGDTRQNMLATTEIDKNSVVYEGTTIIQVNDKKKMEHFQSFRQVYGIPTLVTRTNFITTKGQLIRIILFPKEQENVFQKQSSKFLLFLCFMACISFAILLSFISSYISVEDGIIKFLDIIVIIVPACLPISMTFGIIYALEKLKSKEIFCISQNKIIAGGMIQFLCFDKTGTLTQTFMDFFCLAPAHQRTFQQEILPNKITFDQPHIQNILSNMASNHSIIKIEQTNQLVGDPMEVKVFEFGQFQLNQSIQDADVIFGYQSKRKHNGAVLRRFEFDSDVQRMSVIATNSLTTGYTVYSKGSPEMMLTIMAPNSVPIDYNAVLRSYAASGFRVLALASKPIKGDIKKTTRAEAECDLQFDGFEVFENKLKPQTKQAIHQLLAAEIKCLMITGDNSLTGSNISYECGISRQDKGMIMCDYQHDDFTLEDFSFIQRDKETNALPPPIQPQVMHNNSIHNADMELKEIKTLNEMTKKQKFMTDMIMRTEKENVQLCVTGRAFNELFTGQITTLNAQERRFLEKVTVYARTKPNDKAKVVIVYQHLDMSVGMCGDGANDCGALKQADIGLSLSQAQASISAPFTSKIANISSMVELVKECRAGLATNFSLFNIMATYALIQYSSTIICEKFLYVPSDISYLYWDLVLNFFLILFIGYCQTADTLSIDKPKKSLFCVTNLTQVMLMFGLQLMGQITIISAYALAFNTNDYYTNNGGQANGIANYLFTEDFGKNSPETNAIFYFINPIYTMTQLAFNIGAPWRKSFIFNVPLMIVTVLTLFYSTLMILYPPASWDRFQISFMPDYNFRLYVFGISYAFGIALYCNQKFIMEPLSNWLVKKYPQYKWL